MQDIRNKYIALILILLGILSYSIANGSSDHEDIKESVKSLKEDVEKLGKTLHEATDADNKILDSSCDAKSENCDGESTTKGGTYTSDKENANKDIKHNTHESKEKSVNTGRDARMVLMDKYGELPYKVEYESGPQHAPIYAAEVTVEGQVFKGSGASKKKARLSAAENACKGLKLNC